MPKRLVIAALQMDAAPAPRDERLRRAEALVARAADAGARLVVLPELFNTGYTYSEENFSRAEREDGPTATWMKATAARWNIHLAGSLMLLDRDEVYNALLLFAPDGQVWRYDKSYPWGWERGYFRNGKGVTVAHTSLGAIGMLVCWDVAHPELWRRYAGQVDLMLIASCPPDVSNPTFIFPNGERVTADQLGPIWRGMPGSAERVFSEILNQQTAWLGVPAVNTVGCGSVTTTIPNGRLAFLGLIPLAPWLGRYLPQAGEMQMGFKMVPGCKVVDASGRNLVELTQAQGETFALAEVELRAEHPAPQGSQPAIRLPRRAYLLSDVLLPWTSIPAYRGGLRRVWGRQMAPMRPETRRLAAALGLALAAGLVVGYLVKARLTQRRWKGESNSFH